MDESRVRPLSRMPEGTKATVVRLAGGREFQNRLVSMGLNIGCELEVVHGGGRGGPTLVAVGQTRLAIGYGMARRVMVSAGPGGRTT